MATLKSHRSIVAVLFGLVFVGMGGAFCYFLLVDYTATLETYAWRSVPAVINSLTVTYPKHAPGSRQDNVFELTGLFTYSVGNQQFQSNTLRRKRITDDSFESLSSVKRAMIVGEVDRAFVDPDDPSMAILKRESLWSIVAILFPLVFVTIGVGFVLGGMGMLPTAKPTRSKSRRSPAKPSNANVVGGLIMIAIGGALLIPMLLLPMMRQADARHWIETPCEIVWGRVRTHDGEDGDTYSIDILFRYDVAGQTHHSNHYSFAIGSSSGRGSKRAVVNKYPPGTKTTCFVDPRLPQRAVLVRSLKSLGYWWLFPLGCLSAGIVVVLNGMRARWDKS